MDNNSSRMPDSISSRQSTPRGTVHLWPVAGGQGDRSSHQYDHLGKNPFHVDTVASGWLATNPESRYLHCAIERGLSTILNPMSIPLYEWKADVCRSGHAEQFPAEPVAHTVSRRDYNVSRKRSGTCSMNPYVYTTTYAGSLPENRPQSFMLRPEFPESIQPLNVHSRWISPGRVSADRGERHPGQTVDL